LRRGRLDNTHRSAARPVFGRQDPADRHNTSRGDSGLSDPRHLPTDRRATSIPNQAGKPWVLPLPAQSDHRSGQAEAWPWDPSTITDVGRPGAIPRPPPRAPDPHLQRPNRFAEFRSYVAPLERKEVVNATRARAAAGAGPDSCVSQSQLCRSSTVTERRWLSRDDDTLHCHCSAHHPLNNGIGDGRRFENTFIGRPSAWPKTRCRTPVSVRAALNSFSCSRQKPSWHSPRQVIPYSICISAY